jgi:peptidoglycan/xylan/chitin deacetylase (PgdA/CDA1 family)
MTSAYLTIDDSPSSHMIDKIDLLNDLDIQAIFFCEGAKIDKRREHIIKAINSGHIIGNHSWKHIPFSDLDVSECRSEIRKTDEIIDKIYNQTEQQRKYKYFRFPYGDKGDRKDKDGSKEKRETIQEILNDFNYTSPNFNDSPREKYHPFQGDNDWYWTVNIQEYKCDSFDLFKNKMQTSCDIQNLIDDDSPDILIYHDHENTYEWFSDYINILLDKGVSFLDYNFDQ